MKLKNVNISKQLNIGLGFILISVLLLGAVALYDSDKLSKTTIDLYNHPLKVQRAIGSLQIDILHIRLEMKEMVMENNVSTMEDRIKSINNYETDAYKQLDILYSAYLGPVSDIDTAKASILELKVIRDETIRLLQIGDVEKASERVMFDGAGGLQSSNILENLKVISDFANSKAGQFYVDAQNQRNQIVSQLAIIIIFIFLLSLAISILLRKGIMDPITELIATTSAVKEGNLAARSQYLAKNEFGELSVAFNDMAEVVEKESIHKEKNISELNKAKELTEIANKAIVKAWKYNRNLIEASLDPLVTIGPDGIITDVNKGTEDATGLSRNILIGTSFSRYFTEPEKADVGYMRTFKQGQISDYELTLKHISGNTTPVIYNASVYKDEQGEVIGVFAAARDITKLKEFQNQLLFLKNNLEAANKELEAFSYSVSHDLKAPLRHITGYIALLGKKYMNAIPEEGRQYLENITFSAQNMGELIDGLLQFSKTGRVEMNIKLINMNNIVESLIKPIRQQDIENRIEFNVDAMHTAYGDIEMFKSVWSNLIENAVKFTKNKELAIINIGDKETENEIIYYINDNGAGFDMKYISKLFTVFQRLHSREDYEGTGIGLATVQRILTRHGGKIWAESKIGEGATFYFSLLKRKESE